MPLARSHHFALVSRDRWSAKRDDHRRDGCSNSIQIDPSTRIDLISILALLPSAASNALLESPPQTWTLIFDFCGVSILAATFLGRPTQAEAEAEAELEPEANAKEELEVERKKFKASLGLQLKLWPT